MASSKSIKMAVNIIQEQIQSYSDWYVDFYRTQFVKCPKYCNLHRDVIRNLVQAKKAMHHEKK